MNLSERAFNFNYGNFVPEELSFKWLGKIPPSAPKDFRCTIFLEMEYGFEFGLFAPQVSHEKKNGFQTLFAVHNIEWISFRF